MVMAEPLRELNQLFDASKTLVLEQRLGQVGPQWCCSPSS
jgi:hypothetical protein